MNPADIQDLVNHGALFVCNHSGGKDSQAMLIKMLKVIPRHQIIVVHATLGDIEWPGALELAKKQAEDAGLPFIIAAAERDLLQRVEDKFAKRPDAPSWPGSKFRWCTSDLKRGPIEREIRRFIKRTGHRNIVVNCMGLRAQESPARSKLVDFERVERNCTQSREWFDWLPIHEMLVDEVWATIKDAGQTPHPAYAAGSERLSCVFCIFASKNDLKLGRAQNPELFQRYVAMEKKTGYTMHASMKSLEELTA